MRARTTRRSAADAVCDRSGRLAAATDVIRVTSLAPRATSRLRARPGRVLRARTATATGPRRVRARLQRQRRAGRVRPDDAAPDCNNNGVLDACELSSGTSQTASRTVSSTSASSRLQRERRAGRLRCPHDGVHRLGPAVPVNGTAVQFTIATAPVAAGDVRAQPDGAGRPWHHCDRDEWIDVDDRTASSWTGAS